MLTTRGLGAGPSCSAPASRQVLPSTEEKDLTSGPMWPSAGSVVLPHTHGLTVCRQSSSSVAHTQAAAQVTEGEPIAATAVAAAQ